MPAPPPPSTIPSTASIINIASIATGFAAAYFVSLKPAEVIDYTLEKSASAYVSVKDAAADAKASVDSKTTASTTISTSSSSSPFSFLTRTYRFLTRAVDTSATAMGWKSHLTEFDERSPVKSEQLVVAAVGVTVAIVARKCLQMTLVK